MNARKNATAASIHPSMHKAASINHDVFPENIKQSLLEHTRSRFEQPHEREADALRVTLVRRGGEDVASMWVELP